MGFFKNLFGGSSRSVGSAKSQPLSTPTSRSTDAQRIYEEGVRMLEAGQMREALETFVHAVGIDPNCVDACIALARGMHALDPKEFADQMLHYAEQAFRVAPNNPKARNIAAVAHFEHGKIAWDATNWEEAVRCFKRAHEIEPGDEQILAAFGYCAEQADQLGKFVDACEARLREAPDDHPVKYTLGKTLVKMAVKGSSAPEQPWWIQARAELLRSAERHLTDYLAIDPLSADANYSIGVVYIMTGRLNEAADIVQKLQEIDAKKSKDLEELLTG